MTVGLFAAGIQDVGDGLHEQQKTLSADLAWNVVAGQSMQQDDSGAVCSSLSGCGRQTVPTADNIRETMVGKLLLNNKE